VERGDSPCWRSHRQRQRARRVRVNRFPAEGARSNDDGLSSYVHGALGDALLPCAVRPTPTPRARQNTPPTNRAPSRRRRWCWSSSATSACDSLSHMSNSVAFERYPPSPDASILSSGRSMILLNLGWSGPFLPVSTVIARYVTGPSPKGPAGGIPSARRPARCKCGQKCVLVAVTRSRGGK
jgi:hypothetical protein